MSLAEAEIMPFTSTDSKRYTLWKRTHPDQPAQQAILTTETLELLGTVITPCVLGKPLLYVDPKGDIHRTSKAQAVSSLGIDGYFSVRTRNSEYILKLSPETTWAGLPWPAPSSHGM